MHLLYDISAGTKIYLQLFPIVLALAIFCNGIPVSGLISIFAAMIASAIFGGSKFQISSIAFPLSVLTFEITSKYQYKGLLITAALVCICLFVLGKLRISEILRFTSYAFLSAIITFVSISVLILQLQYLLELSASSLYTSLLGNVSSLFESFKDITPSAIYSALLFLSPLLIMKIIFRGYWPYFMYIVSFMIIYLCADWNLIHLPDFLAQTDRIGKEFFSDTNFENIFYVSLTIPSHIMMENVITSAFAVSLVIASQASFCTNIASSLTGDTRSQTNVELISSGIANLVSVALGGFFVAPDRKSVV